MLIKITESISIDPKEVIFIGGVRSINTGAPHKYCIYFERGNAIILTPEEYAKLQPMLGVLKLRI